MENVYLNQYSIDFRNKPNKSIQPTAKSAAADFALGCLTPPAMLGNKKVFAMKINIDLIKQQLFADPKIRARILRDYGIEKQPFNAHELGMSVVGMFDQEPSPQPLQQSVNNAQVFRAAVKSLRSNSRAWATFLKFEPALRELLHDYDPVQSALDLSQHKLALEQIKTCLPGQSSSADALAIKQWADLLSGEENYYGIYSRYWPCISMAIPRSVR